jgi:hypothetical protein
MHGTARGGERYERTVAARNVPNVVRELAYKTRETHETPSHTHVQVSERLRRHLVARVFECPQAHVAIDLARVV